jgi:hypothetical protein
MSSIFNKEEDDIKWWDIAACHGMNTNLFFDTYETDINIAKNIDEACLSCPVISLCYESGINNQEYGVWGGVYLSAGEIDKTRNFHKTKEVWKRLKAKNVS